MPGPSVDHHVHLFSADASRQLEIAIGRPVPPFTVEDLLPVLDRDGVERAVALSAAYLFGRSNASSEANARLIAAENDWFAQQIEKHPDRFVGFFSVDPLLPSACAEIERCASAGVLGGLKLHLANSRVDLRNRSHLEMLASVVDAADTHRLPVVVHLRTTRHDFGREDAQAFIEHVLHEAPEVSIQIAHAAGWGGYDAATHAALGAFFDRLAAPDAPQGVFFDLSAVVRPAPETKSGGKGESAWSRESRYQKLVEHLRRIGLEGVLFGTDWPDWTPGSYAEDLLSQLPLEANEFDRIFSNRAPWLR